MEVWFKDTRQRSWLVLSNVMCGICGEPLPPLLNLQNYLTHSKTFSLVFQPNILMKRCTHGCAFVFWHLNMHAALPLIFSLFVFHYKPSVWDSFVVCLFTPPFSFHVCGCLCMCMGMHMNVFMLVWVWLPAVKLVISEALYKMLCQIAFDRSRYHGICAFTDHCSALYRPCVAPCWFHRFC